jgi:HlyD family secretion protein
MPVRLLIDAFNYSDWGFINGAVVEIPDDYAVINNRPVFRTVVKLEATELALQSGTRRQLKKGMTLRARFVVAERSLWQLLRDDINDWLNPLQRPA